jgi:hypothetical protein
MPEWGVLSAIVAIIGVSWTVYSFINKLRKRIRIELSTAGRRSDEPRIDINLMNDSEPQVTIVRILIREEGGNLIELCTQDFDLPKTIQNKQYIKLNSPYLAHNINKITEICAEEATGKKWKVSKKNLTQSKKILRNYIGKRLIFPSMGDELDENKIR